MASTDSDKNPIQDRYTKGFDNFTGLSDAENKGTVDGDKKTGVPDDPSADIKGAEENPNSQRNGIINNVTGNKSGKSKATGRFSGLKKKGPLAAIIVAIFGGGFGIFTLLGPSTIVFQFVATELGHFNTQLGSMDSRTISMYSDKTTGGVLCTSVLSIACKYSTMSDKQVSNFQDAGIDIEADGTTILGRIKPKNFIFNDEVIPANEFKSALKTNPDFAQAVDDAYNPKFAGFSDNVFVQWVEQKLGISKAAENLDGTTDAEKLASLEKDTETPVDTSSGTVSESDTNPATGKNYTPKEVADINNQSNSISTDSAAIADSGETIGGEELAKAEAAAGTSTGVATSAVSDTLGALGLAHAACMAYGGIQAVGFAAKTVRSMQLQRFGWSVLNVESQARAGVVKPEDMAFMGKLLTETDADGKSATDSFGYKYASYGSSGAGSMPTSSTRYMAGGGLAGSLTNLYAVINKVLVGGPQKVCGFVTNPFVVGGSLIAGAALLIAAPNVSVTKVILQAAPMATLYLGISLLPAMLKDIVAGVLVDKTTVGSAAGDALTSGISGMMSNSAKAGGNAPLTPNQAVAYANYSNDIAAKYAKKDQLAYSPLDPTNSNTFMGKIVAQLIPYSSKMSTLSGILGSVASLTTGSLASITTPTTKAASASDYTQCQDEDYRTLGVATDPFCNVIYGIPPDALTADPITVANKLVNQGQIDPGTGDPAPGSDYETFITDCINRDRPLGNTSNGSKSDGSKCLFSKSNQNFYLHYIDQRVDADMENEVSTMNSSTTTAANTTTSTATGGTITIETFGYDFGKAPTGMQYVADVRDINLGNLNFKPTENGYANSTPRSAETVRSLIMALPKAKAWLKKLQDTWTPQLHDGSKVAIGCSKGHHRSVTLAVTFGNWLKTKAYNVVYINRDLSKSW